MELKLNTLIIHPEKLVGQPCRSSPGNHNDFDEISLTFHKHFKRGLFIRTECFNFFFKVASCLYIIQNGILTWKLNAFTSLIANVSINIKKYFEEKENPNLPAHFWNYQILDFQNSLSSISTLLSMYRKLCLWKCTRYSDRLTETGGNFLEFIFMHCIYVYTGTESVLWQHNTVTVFSSGFLNIFSIYTSALLFQ